MTELGHTYAVVKISNERFAINTDFIKDILSTNKIVSLSENQIPFLMGRIEKNGAIASLIDIHQKLELERPKQCSNIYARINTPKGVFAFEIEDTEKLVEISDMEWNSHHNKMAMKGVGECADSELGLLSILDPKNLFTVDEFETIFKATVFSEDVYKFNYFYNLPILEKILMRLKGEKISFKITKPTKKSEPRETYTKLMDTYLFLQSKIKLPNLAFDTSGTIIPTDVFHLSSIINQALVEAFESVPAGKESIREFHNWYNLKKLKNQPIRPDDVSLLLDHMFSLVKAI